jgi:hypothetical protein
MPRITNATKVETVRELTIADYGDTTLRFSTDGDTVTVSLAIPDPRGDARIQLRAFIENGLQQESFMMSDVIAELDRLDAAATEKHGDGAGRPKKHIVTIYNIERDVVEVLIQLLSNSSISYTTRETVNKALTQPTDRW